jgi:hypothetical protein
MLALRTRAFPAGNGEGLNLDFEGIVAGWRLRRTGKNSEETGNIYGR